MLPDIQVVNQPNGRRAIFEVSQGKFLHEDLTETELLDRLAFLFRPVIKAWLDKKPLQMSYLECQIRAERIKCCDCGTNAVTISSYEASWPITKQRCTACKG